VCLQTSSTFSHNEQWLYDMSGRTGKKVDPTLFVSRIRCFEQSFPTVDLRYSSCSASMPQTFFDAHCLKAPFVYFLQCVSAKMLFMYLPASLMSYILLWQYCMLNIIIPISELLSLNEVGDVAARMMRCISHQKGHHKGESNRRSSA